MERVDLGEILELVRDKRYFVLHAPRQTGKASILLTLRAASVACIGKVEAAQAAREHVEHAMRAVLSVLAFRARSLGGRVLYGV